MELQANAIVPIFFEDFGYQIQVAIHAKQALYQATKQGITPYSVC